MALRNYYFYFFAACSLFLPFSVNAVTITPVGQSVSLEQGERTEVSVEITNESAISRTYEPYVLGISYDNSGSPVYSEENGPIAWVQVPDTITIEPNGSRTIDFLVQVPDAAIPGAYYLALFAGESARGQIAAEAHVGSVLTVYVAGDITESLYVRDLSVTSEKFFDAKRTGSVSIHNDGNIHVATQLAYQLKGRNNEFEGSALSIGQVYKNMDRTETFSFDLPTWYVGTMTLTVVGTYGISEHVLQGTTSFFYVSPYALYVAIGVIVLLTIVWWYIRSKKQRIDI